MATLRFCALVLMAHAAALALAFAALMLTPLPAGAHDAPKGWAYPFACCSDYDCRAVTAGREGVVQERPEGYVIAATGEVIPYSDARVKHSPDGDFHWCSVAGKADGRTICLFVPPRSF